MPDARGGFGADRRSTVLRAIGKTYEDIKNRSECNEFVKSVVSIVTRDKVRFSKDANANKIFEEIQKDPWHKLGSGEEGLRIAGVMAAHEGKLVVAAWKNPTGGHGHCAIVIDFTNSKRPPDPDTERHIGELRKNTAVIAQGKHNHPEESFEYMKVTKAFKKQDLAKVVCSYIDIA